MEIKTLSEMRNQHVTVRVQEAERFQDSRVQVVVTVPSSSAYDPDAAAEVLAGNYDRAQRRIELMKEAEKGYQSALRQLQDQLAEQQSARRRAEVQRDGYDNDRRTERDRADRLAESIRLLDAQQAEMDAAIMTARQEADRIAQEANARERRQAEEIGRRFTSQQVEDAKADARAEARASEGARIRSEIRAIVSPETGLAQADAGDLYEVICRVRALLDN